MQMPRWRQYETQHRFSIGNYELSPAGIKHWCFLTPVLISASHAFECADTNCRRWFKLAENQHWLCSLFKRNPLRTSSHFQAGWMRGVTVRLCTHRAQLGTVPYRKQLMFVLKVAIFEINKSLKKSQQSINIVPKVLHRQQCYKHPM